MMPATGSTATGEGVGQKISRKANEALDSVKAAMPGSHTTTTGTHTTAGTHTTHTTTGAHGTHGGVAQKAEQAFEKAKAAIPGTAEHGALHPHTAGGGVHHTTGTGHQTTTGAGTGGVAYKAEAALAGVKEKIPGTAEHKATHPTTGHGHVAGGMGTTGMGGMGTGTTHTTTTGTTGTHGGGIGTKVGAAVAGVKEKIPGTAEHKATHPTL